MTLLHRSWTDEDARRYLELRRIFGPDRHGSVEGVEFDLRHPLIDQEEWFTYILGVDPRPYRKPDEPFIWFPWMGTFDKETLRSELMADELRFGRTPDNKRFEAFVRQFTPEYFVYAGDALVIDRVECQPFGDHFAHRHDNEIRLAYLRIVRANGKLHKIKTPLAFIGNTSLFARRSMRDYFNVICQRIMDHFGLKNLSDVKSLTEDEFNQRSYAIGALERAYFLAEHTQEARRIDYFGGANAIEERDAKEKVKLLNDAVLLGYIWAKAEDESGMQPLADAAIRAKQGGVAGGRKSGAARREKRATTWEPHARDLAASIRAQEPTLSQDRLAEEIGARWKLNEIAPPGHKTLKDLISNMEIRGELPRRVRNRQ